MWVPVVCAISLSKPRRIHPVLFLSMRSTQSDAIAVLAWVGGTGVVGVLRGARSGKVVALLAVPGQAVEKGTPLLILEAMKMEHTVIAPKNGVVNAFLYAAGDQVKEGAELVEFEAEKQRAMAVD